jgi:hypothetical protein
MDEEQLEDGELKYEQGFLAEVEESYEDSYGVCACIQSHLLAPFIGKQVIVTISAYR